MLHSALATCSVLACIACRSVRLSNAQAAHTPTRAAADMQVAAWTKSTLTHCIARVGSAAVNSGVYYRPDLLALHGGSSSAMRSS
jgi:hypothetical protein